jgi:hypothetical protein
MKINIGKYCRNIIGIGDLGVSQQVYQADAGAFT